MWLCVMQCADAHSLPRSGPSLLSLLALPLPLLLARRRCRGRRRGHRCDRCHGRRCCLCLGVGTRSCGCDGGCNLVGLALRSSATAASRLACGSMPSAAALLPGLTTFQSLAVVEAAFSASSLASASAERPILRFVRTSPTALGSVAAVSLTSMRRDSREKSRPLAAKVVDGASG